MPYRILNWDKYQGWKTEQKKRPDSAPPYPWLKLHRKTLDSMDFFGIPEQVRWQWFALLCLSDDNGTISETDERIAWRLRVKVFDSKPFINTLLESISDGVPMEFRCASDVSPTRGEEKRVEEIEKREEDKDLLSEPIAPAPPDDDLIGYFPLKDGAQWPLKREFLTLLETTYETEAQPDWVFPECKAAKAWLIANPERQKTARGMKRYLNSWMHGHATSGSKLTSSERVNLKAARDVDLQAKAKERLMRHRNGSENGQPESIAAILDGMEGGSA